MALPLPIFLVISCHMCLPVLWGLKTSVVLLFHLLLVLFTSVTELFAKSLLNFGMTSTLLYDLLLLSLPLNVSSKVTYLILPLITDCLYLCCFESVIWSLIMESVLHKCKNRIEKKKNTKRYSIFGNYETLIFNLCIKLFIIMFPYNF